MHIAAKYGAASLRHFLIAFTLLSFLNIPLAGSAHAAEKLTFGFLPYFSAAKLVELHRPLNEYLNAHMDIKVSMVSAPGFKDFKERTAKGEYDLIFTAPHMAQLAEIQTDYQRVAMSTHRGRPIFLAKKGSSVVNLDDLKGKTISLPPTRAINHHVALKALKENGLVVGESVTVVVTPSHNSALLSVLNGQVAVAVMGKSPWGSYKKKYKNQVNVLATSSDFPGFLVMANSNMAPAMVEKIKGLMLKFKETKKGKAYFKKTALENFTVIGDDTMAELDPYVKGIFGVSAK